MVPLAERKEAKEGERESIKTKDQVRNAVKVSSIGPLTTFADFPEEEHRYSVLSVRFQKRQNWTQTLDYSDSMKSFLRKKMKQR